MFGDIDAKSVKERCMSHLLPLCVKRSALERYLSIVEYFIPKTVVRHKGKMRDVERHHILPVSLFPEFEKCYWNLVDLPLRVHYIVHGILVQITRSPKMVFAFNNMRRVCNGRSSFYPLVRKMLSAAISECNSGRALTEEQKKIISERTKGMVVVKDPKDPSQLLRVSVEDERYKSGELVFFRTGETQTDQCKSNISEGNKGKICMYHSENEEIRYIRTKSEILELESLGFKRGTRPSSKLLLSQIVSDTVWVHDPNSKQSIRINRASEIPDGFELGRGEFDNKGALIGSKYICVFNICELRKEKILPEFFDRTKHIIAANHREVKKIFLFNEMVAATSKDLSNAFAVCGVYAPEFNIYADSEDHIIPKLNGREKTQELKQFRKRYAGLSMSQLGLKVIEVERITVEEVELVKICLEGSV